MDSPSGGVRPKPLVDFYRGERPDSAGRWLREIRSWGPDRLEHTHDYIQWLFPARSRSQFNASAPTLDEEQIRDFRADERLQAELILSFHQMLAFYGFAPGERDGAVTVERSPDWAERSRAWLSPGNHNFLRITRILTCLRVLGLRDHAQAFRTALEDLYRESPEVIGSRTVEFWRSAAG